MNGNEMRDQSRPTPDDKFCPASNEITNRVREGFLPIFGTQLFSSLSYTHTHTHTSCTNYTKGSTLFRPKAPGIVRRVILPVGGE